MEVIRAWCREVVGSSYPDELAVFDFIWERMRAERWMLRPLSEHRDGERPFAGGLGFDDLTGGDLHATWVAIAVPAVLAELRAVSTAPSLEQVQEAVFQCSRSFGAPVETAKQIQHALAERLVQSFDRLMADYRASLQAVEGSLTTTGLWVEWCSTFAAANESPSVEARRLDERGFEEVVEQVGFDCFWLFVDERAAGVTVRTRLKTRRAKPEFIPWSSLTGRQQLLLGLFLTSFRTRGPVSNDAIASKVLDVDLADRYYGIDARIRTLKSELDRALGGVLGEVMRAEKGLRRYVPTGQIPYCWIRPNQTSSRLLLAR